VETACTAPAALVLAEAYHPNWRARVDGKETPVFVADCVLRGVSVPAGNARVRFEFADPALTAGVRVSGISGVLVAVLLAAGALQARRRRARAGPGPEARA
jgi:uncharacterized membrane protein YfhO